MKIGFIGMSHLGIVSSLAIASKNNQVICFDNDKKLIEKLKNDIFPIEEPKLNNIYKKNKKKVTFTNSFNDLNVCEIVYLSLDVKTKNHGKSDLSDITKLLKKVTTKLNKEIIFVILCQVPPNFTRNINWPKKKLYYQVETLIFGQAFERALKPERIIIGSSDKKYIPKKYSKLLQKFNCPIIQMSYESAELAKISINLFLISQVTTTNSIAEVAKKINADWNDIKLALLLDKRIGRYSYLNPGLGISGGNLERDLKTIISLSKKNRTNNILFKNFETLSNYGKNWTSKKIYELVIKNRVKKIRIGILGLTYKKNTHSIKNSPAIEFIKKNKNKKIIAYDPSMPKSLQNDKLIIVDNYKKVLKNCNILLIMNDWDEFKNINLSSMAEMSRPRIVIDPFSMLYNLNLNENKFVYESLQR